MKQNICLDIPFLLIVTNCLAHVLKPYISNKTWPSVSSLFHKIDKMEYDYYNVLFYWPTFCNSHSLLSNGQTLRVFNQRSMQCKWKPWLHVPHAIKHSSVFWSAWHSMHRSLIWFRQMAQFSVAISHVHNATALHFLTSKRGLFLSTPSSPDFFTFFGFFTTSPFGASAFFWGFPDAS